MDLNVLWIEMGERKERRVRIVEVFHTGRRWGERRELKGAALKRVPKNGKEPSSFEKVGSGFREERLGE